MTNLSIHLQICSKRHGGQVLARRLNRERCRPHVRPHILSLREALGDLFLIARRHYGYFHLRVPLGQSALFRLVCSRMSLMWSTEFRQSFTLTFSYARWKARRVFASSCTTPSPTSRNGLWKWPKSESHKFVFRDARALTHFVRALFFLSTQVVASTFSFKLKSLIVFFSR